MEPNGLFSWCVQFREPLGQMGPQSCTEILALLLTGGPEPHQQLTLILIDDAGRFPAGHEPFEEVLDCPLPRILAACPRRVGEA